jgi:hypothetical protein
MENKYPKISLQDIVKNNKFSSKETLEIKKKVDALNKFIEENPEYIEHLQRRYPKDNPRLSRIRHKLDGMLSASDEYLKKQFPENQRLFDEVKKLTEKSIELTNPKTFKNKNTKSLGRFFKKSKPKTWSEQIDEKIKQLDNDMKKTNYKPKKMRKDQ